VAGLCPCRPEQLRPPDDHRAAAYDIQIWFFYAYNVGALGFNHQADWEHITISVSSDLAFVSAYYAEHRGGRRFDRAAQLGWVDATHPVVYAARGTHASYPSAGAYRTPALIDRCYDGGPRWETWKNFVNLGEHDHVLGGQDWARYDGRWGARLVRGHVGPGRADVQPPLGERRQRVSAAGHRRARDPVGPSLSGASARPIRPEQRHRLRPQQRAQPCFALGWCQRAGGDSRCRRGRPDAHRLARTEVADLAGRVGEERHGQLREQRAGRRNAQREHEVVGRGRHQRAS